MPWPAQLRSLCRSLLHRRRNETDLDDEIRAACELLAEEERLAGHAPDQARRLAALALGGVEPVKERVRDARPGAAVDGMVRDLRYGVRTLTRNPGFFLAAITSIATGIAATTAGVSAIDALVWNPYPYRGADRLSIIKLSERAGPLNPHLMTPAEFREVLDAAALDGGVIWDAFWTSTTNAGLTESVRTGKLSASAFEFLGVPPLLGRTFSSDRLPNDEPEPVVVLGYDFWRTRFNGSPAVLGRTLALDQRDYTIIGVMPARFRFLDSEVYVPLTQAPGPYFSMVRLKPGVSLAAASAELQSIVHHQAQVQGYAGWQDLRIQLSNARDAAVGHLSQVLWVLLAAVSVLLTISCLNVSILLLGRGLTRRHELAIRAAVGASDRRLLQQLLTEALVLSLSGAAIGVVLGQALLQAIARLTPPRLLPPDMQLQLNGPVLVVTVAVALATGIGSALWPAVRLSRHRGSLARCFHSPRLTGATGRAHGVLVCSQVALTVVLLAAAGAAFRTFVTLTRAPLGYDAHDVVVLNLTLRDGGYPSWGERVAYYEALRQRVAEVPGVESVAIATASQMPPLIPNRTALGIAGRITAAGDRVLMQPVSGDYFEALRIPLQRGRLWSPGETRRPAHVAVINDTMARRYWPDANPLGQRLRLANLKPFSTFQVDSPGNDQWVEVVGVVGDARNDGLRAPSIPAVYVPYSLLVGDGLVLLARSTVGPATIDRSARQAIAAVDPNQLVVRTYTMDERLWEAGWAREQFVGWLFAACAVAALLIAAVGLYSVVNCVVAQRWRECGLRRALGASGAHILGVVLHATAVSVSLGLAAGATLIALLNRPLAAWTQSSLWDARTVLPALLVLAAAGLGAAFVPAWRALRTGPMDALRAE